MSKTYGLPGLRIGWLATKNQDILEKIAILKEYTTICNAAPSEFLATLALRYRTKILEKNIHIIHSNLPLYQRFFEKHADLFSWYQPNAGPIAFVKMLFDSDDMTLYATNVKFNSVDFRVVKVISNHLDENKGFIQITDLENNELFIEL